MFTGFLVNESKIDISATGHEYKGLQKVAVTNRSFSQLTPKSNKKHNC